MRRIPLVMIAALAGSAHAHGTAAHAGKPMAAPAAAGVQQVFGVAGEAGRVARTVVIDMSDAMRFAPANIRVRKGETLRLVVNNRGKVLHELVLGTDAELRAHAELMRKFPGMEHDAPHMVHVPPGGRDEIVWRFNRTGDFRYACLIPGHFEAGMAGSISVR